VRRGIPAALVAQDLALPTKGSHSHPGGDFAPYRALFSDIPELGISESIPLTEYCPFRARTHQWYNERPLGLGVKFTREVDQAIAQILEKPLAFPVIPHASSSGNKATSNRKLVKIMKTYYPRRILTLTVAGGLLNGWMQSGLAQDPQSDLLCLVEITAAESVFRPERDTDPAPNPVPTPTPSDDWARQWPKA
jgi:hypothetical protein